MSPELEVLIIGAITVSFLHTIAGPDHYLPFIALSKTRGWKFSKTILWTVICGCGHVWSSVLLGLCGAALGWSVSKIEGLQFIRGGLAGWSLLGFGLIYCIWGIMKGQQNRRHKHFDVYNDGSVYVFEHNHDEAVMPKERHRVTPWVMFIIFVLGPCEPMIPLLYYPAARSSLYGMFLLIIVYTAFTLVTMVLMVTMGYYGFSLLKTNRLERHMHALGGFTIFTCGAGMVLMGW